MWDLFISVTVMFSVGGEHRLKTNSEELAMGGIETGRKMGRDKVRETMRALCIDFISAFPSLTRQDIFQASGTLPPYVISTVITALITVMSDLSCAT